jgi:hypothetical protein
MKHHLKHLAMCAPMILVGGVLVATGAGFAAIIPALGCVLMMTLMMGGMAAAMSRHKGHGEGH